MRWTMSYVPLENTSNNVHMCLCSLLVVQLDCLLANNFAALLAAVSVHFVLGGKHNNNNFVWRYRANEPNRDQLCHRVFYIRIHGVWIRAEPDHRHHRMGQRARGRVQELAHPHGHVHEENGHHQASQERYPWLPAFRPPRGEEQRSRNGSQHDSKDPRGTQNLVVEKCLWDILWQNADDFLHTWNYQDLFLPQGREVHLQRGDF